MESITDRYYEEGKKFESILSSCNILVKLNLSFKSEPDFSLNVVEKYYPGEDFSVGFRISHESNGYIITALIMQEHENVDIGTRAELCKLLAQFYDKVILNEHL